jgi:hypothetical protein
LEISDKETAVRNNNPLNEEPRVSMREKPLAVLYDADKSVFNRTKARSKEKTVKRVVDFSIVGRQKFFELLKNTE